ncbi:pentatricopeptide repeat-containing protein At5g04810, chloroplastic-like [Capsella rubella]|uniref:pentatricopeptide repeat-containing protein At5g04810, chloroplastic-like n=1 Tax=Capsella rubella TaxID=81985 RepID=UPI000CD4F502|nr:pentatricopeptide repeat-containing protein At5g04810, chloroplastic-like [Capsella rubella]
MNDLLKPSRKEFSLMVKYYGRKGDVHRARETFESMCARRITPTSRTYTTNTRELKHKRLVKLMGCCCDGDDDFD